jgi:hypothetical protein
VNLLLLVFYPAAFWVRTKMVLWLHLCRAFLTDNRKKSTKKINRKKTEKNELKKTRTQPLPHPPTAGANRYRTKNLRT